MLIKHFFFKLKSNFCRKYKKKGGIMPLLNYILPLLAATCGGYLLKYPPKNKNSFFAFKTPLARLSDKTWIFAQKRCGILLIVLGITLFFLSILCNHFLGSCVKYKLILNLLICSLQAILIFSSLSLVDFEIAECFDDKGNLILR